MEKPSGMTSNVDDIKLVTGLEIGKVFLGECIFDSQKSGNRVLDCATGNFHLFPVLDTEVQCKTWRDYFEFENRIWEELRKNLQDTLDESYLAKSGGCRGTLTGIPVFYQKKCLNKFFKYLQIKKGNRYYTILLKRFFIDKSKSVNCKFGEVQFYSSTDVQINEHIDIETYNISTYVYKKIIKERENQVVPKILVHYPASYQGQNEKMIRLSHTCNSVNVYNPKGFKSLLDISDSNIKQYAARLAKAFALYIMQIEKANLK